ncbi:hypothetical protein SADUNF_Sadunf09G0098800 [Salix dunnii]|uniref:Uncharacterized protein n=1 Tax=Salix dunnii TaxID=1413687 RepID=A0A835MWJ1_9ROSI|nr:hypothetical protein SADUNF_Sadunf09G0098800 [Salix dunnii]
MHYQCKTINNCQQKESDVVLERSLLRLQVFFRSIKACGEWISLVGASRIIILDAHLNPSVTRKASIPVRSKDEGLSF